MEATGIERDRAGELSYWLVRKDAEGRFENYWFEDFYTTHFGLTLADYTGKRVLDIGCGPRGSLEWATTAMERVGVDPLADEYRKLGAADQAMTYVAAGAESVPYPDGHFDIVCSFNSLDHVDDLAGAIGEMKRVLAVGGLALLLTDVHEEPTPQEPICFGWDVVCAVRTGVGSAIDRVFREVGRRDLSECGAGHPVQPRGPGTTLRGSVGPLRTRGYIWCRVMRCARVERIELALGSTGSPERFRFN